LWRRLAERKPPAGQILAHKLSEIYGYRIVYPQDDHIIEFYPFLSRVRGQHDLPYGLKPWLDLSNLPPEPIRIPTSDEVQVEREAYLKDFRQQLSKTSPISQTASVATGEGLGRLIEAIARGKRVVHIVNIPNQGAITNLASDAVVEAEAVTDSAGVRPIHVGEAPIALAGLLQKRIAWQELVADAGATGDRRLALQALLLDEMSIGPEDSEQMLDELLEASRPMLPQFFK
jgi:alpha-galactosidase/6-phospho-beta-glucosidase family protein